MRDARVFVRVRACLEQHPHRLDSVVVERVRQAVRAARLGAVLEQNPQAFRALGLGGVVDRLSVVRVGARLEQDARELRIVDDSCGAVERGHLAVLVRERRVRVCTAEEQLTREVRVGEDRVRHVENRRPAERAAGPVRVALPALPEHEPHPRVALQIGLRREQALRVPLPSGRRGDGERLGARLERRDERRPARVPGLPREDELRVGEDRLAPAEPLERVRVSPTRRLDELLRLLAKLLEIHDRPPSVEPGVRVVGREKRSAVSATSSDEVGSALPADRMRPRAHPESY